MQPVPLSHDLSGLSELARRRVLMTLSCRDSDDIPKVANAGECFESDEGRFQLMHNGIKVGMGLYHGDWTVRLIHQLKGHHEPQEEKVFHELLQHVPPGATMLELGGFWAYYSLWFNARIAGARNFVAEPDPHNLEVGKANFALNGRAARFFRAMVGDRSAPALHHKCESDQVVRPCDQIGVDDFMRDEGIDFLDVLHADVQGAELAMLHGAKESIRRGKVRFVFISTHHHSISEDPLIHQRCLAFLRERNARILAEHTVSESFSGDGLIVASFLPSDRHLPEVAITRNRAALSFFGEAEVDLARAFEERAQAREELARVRDQISALERLASEARQVASQAQQEVERLQNSRSWRYTQPIRRAVRWLRAA